MCSELIYKAYQDTPGVTFALSTINGRSIFSPNQFAEKFDQEYGTDTQELDLIVFLDGNEKEKFATQKDAEVFRTSWKRPKWHIIEDFVNIEKG